MRYLYYSNSVFGRHLLRQKEWSQAQMVVLRYLDCLTFHNLVIIKLYYKIYRLIDLIKLSYFVLVSHIAYIVILYNMADSSIIYKIDIVVLYTTNPSPHATPNSSVDLFWMYIVTVSIRHGFCKETETSWL